LLNPELQNIVQELDISQNLLYSKTVGENITKIIGA
jgi:hypothetical protein